MNRLVITNNGRHIKSLTDDEINKERQQAEQQARLDALKPSPDEVEEAEFELKTINLLVELGVNI